MRGCCAIGEHVVGIRLDDGSARYENWSESTDHEPTFIGGRIEFAKTLSGVTKLTFQFAPFDGSPRVATFDFRGLNNQLHGIAEGCS
jgi:hypothetical protein